MSLDYLVGLVGRIGQWSYLLLFVGAMLESAAMVGVLVPGEAFILAAGFFASQGAFDLDALIVVVAIGATIGDSLGYELGRHWGRAVLVRHGTRFGVTQARLEWVDGFYATYGGLSVFLGRFVGFARALVPFLAGSSRMPYVRFLAYNAIGAVLWSIAIVLLGYFVGASWHAVESWIGRVTAILAGVTALGLLFRIRGKIRSVVTLDAVALVVSVCIFGAIAEDVVTRDPLTVVDTRLAGWFAVHRSEAMTSVMLAVSHLHAPVPVTLVIVALGVLLLWKRQYRWLTTFISATAGGTLLNLILKHAFHRARPTVDHGVLVFSGFSFPSGHVAAATLLYGFAAAYAVTHFPRLAWRVTAVVGAFVMVTLVGVTRMYLGAHFLSDVVGAFAAAIAWLTLCLIVFQGRFSGWTWQRFEAAALTDNSKNLK